MPGIDLEALKQALSNDDVSILLAKIDKLAMANDRSCLRVLCTIIPDNIPIVARMTWSSAGPDAGIFQFPQKNDLVVLGQVDSDEDQAFVLARLTSKVDKIPIQAVDGSTVIRALSGKKTHLLSDTRVNLGRGGAEPVQPLVLGTIFKNAYSSHLGQHSSHADHSSKHKHIGNAGFLTAVPDIAASFSAVKSAVDAIKAAPVDNAAMLSDLSFTEK